MSLRIVFLLAATAALAAAAKLPDWYSRKLENIEFEARLVQGVERIESITGDSLDGDYILIEMKVRPLYGSRVALRRDDFLLRSRRGNDTSEAQSPERIAGDAVLALGVSQKGSGNVFRNAVNTPIYGGAPGTNSRPRRLESEASGLGGVVSGETETTLEQRRGGGATLAGRLAQLELPLETDDNAAGYLYFQVPAKVKRKHLELSYNGAFGEFIIVFKQPE